MNDNFKSDLLDTLYNWTMKTSQGNQEEYNNLWLEIDLGLRICERFKEKYPHIYKTILEKELEEDEKCNNSI